MLHFATACKLKGGAHFCIVIHFEREKKKEKKRQKKAKEEKDKEEKEM